MAKGWGLVPRRPMDCLSAEPNRQSVTGKDKPSEGASPEVLANAARVANGYSMIQWSPTGDWIAFPSADGIAMIAPDGTRLRKVTSCKVHGFAFPGMALRFMASSTTFRARAPHGSSTP